MSPFESFRLCFEKETCEALDSLVKVDYLLDDLADIIKMMLVIKPKNARFTQKYTTDETVAMNDQWEYSHSLGYHKHIMVNQSCVDDPEKCASSNSECIKLCQCRCCCTFQVTRIEESTNFKACSMRISGKRVYKESTNFKVCPMYAREILEYDEDEVENFILKNK